MRLAFVFLIAASVTLTSCESITREDVRFYAPLVLDAAVEYGAYRDTRDARVEELRIAQRADIRRGAAFVAAMVSAYREVADIAHGDALGAPVEWIDGRPVVEDVETWGEAFRRAAAWYQTRYGEPVGALTERLLRARDSGERMPTDLELFLRVIATG